MCARFTSAHTKEEIELLFGLANATGYLPRYNIAPGQTVPVVRLAPGGAERELVGLKWGLIPGWARADTPQAAAGLVNAKSETVAEKPAFRDALRHRRCLVPADGFIEWETLAGKKQPHWFRLADGRRFAFAGIWEPAAPGARQPLPTFAILTVSASEDVRVFHDRMPVILLPEQFDQWLDPAAHWADLQPLLKPLPKGMIVSHPVSPTINHPKHDRPELLQPIAASLFG